MMYALKKAPSMFLQYKPLQHLMKRHSRSLVKFAGPLCPIVPVMHYLGPRFAYAKIRLYPLKGQSTKSRKIRGGRKGGS